MSKSSQEYYNYVNPTHKFYSPPVIDPNLSSIKKTTGMLWEWGFDSKHVGVGYLILSFLGGVLGFSFSTLMSVELSAPFSVIEEYFYYVSVTVHGLVMLFYFLTPMASGLFNYLIPQLCHVGDMFSGSLNVLNLFLMVISGLIVVLSLMLGEGLVTGWTLYVPLSSKPFSMDDSVDLLITGIHMFTVSVVLSSLNLLLTVLSKLYLVKHILNISPFVWAGVVTSILTVLCLPALSCALSFLLLDSKLNSYIFVTEFGGDPMLFQVLFWYFGHPEVYILMVPVFGVVSHMLGSKGHLFNKSGINFSLMVLGVLSFLVFGHHMCTVGWGVDISSFFMSSTMAMSVPTGVKVFSWLFDLALWGFKGGFHMLFIVLFVFHFTLGGMSGFFLANTHLDFFFHDTWFVVGHLHVVLAISSVFGFLSSIFWLFGEDSGLGKLKISFSVMLVGSLNCMFIPFHIVGVLGLQSSVSCYPLDLFLLFYMESISFLGILGASVLFAVMVQLITILSKSEMLDSTSWKGLNNWESF